MFHRSRARSLRAVLLTSCALAPLSSAQTPATPEVKVPRPLPHMLDLKTPAPAPAPSPIAQDDARPAPRGHSALPAKLDETRATRPARAIDFSRVHVDEPGDGSIWAHGASYKASLDGRRLTYVPFFGSNAPRNFPVAFEVASITVGGASLPFAASGALHRSDDRVVVDRGATQELFDLDPDGVKQELVFDALPRGGDLRVSLAVTSELEPRVGDAGIEFGNELGFVRYGKATAFDAAGKSLELESVWNDGAIELSIPASFLERARFPVTIDPVISTFAVDSSASDEQSSDITYDASVNAYYVCWERVYSATDHDVWGQLHDASGSVIPGTLDTIDFTTTWWAHPRCATNALNTQFLVVAAVGDPAAAARTIWGREREAESLSQSNQFQISDVGAFGDLLDPDVGGDPLLFGPTYYCVVWTRVFTSTDRDVHARLVTPSATLVGTSILYIDNSGSTVDVNPSISKSDGPAPISEQDWNIVWERTLTNGFSETHAARVHWDGIVSSSSFLVPSAGGRQRRPSASAGADVNGTRYWMIAYERDFSTDNDIGLAAMQGATMLETTTLPALELNGLLYQNQVQPAIETDGTCFLVAYSEQYQSSSFDYDVWASAVYFNGTQSTLVEGHRNFAYSGTFENDPQLTSERSGGGASRRFGGSWTDDDFSNVGNIEGAIYECPTSAPIESFCFGDGSAGVPCPCGGGFFGAGCPNSVFAGGAILIGFGSANVSNDTFVIQGSDMPNATAVYFQATDSTSPFVIDDGIMCAGGTIIRLGSKLNQGNFSQYPGPGDQPISVRGQIPAAAGVSRVYQAFYRNAASFCTSATSNRTNALRVTWLP